MSTGRRKPRISSAAPPLSPKNDTPSPDLRQLDVVLDTIHQHQSLDPVPPIAQRQRDLIPLLRGKGQARDVLDEVAKRLPYVHRPGAKSLEGQRKGRLRPDNGWDHARMGNLHRLRN